MYCCEGSDIGELWTGIEMGMGTQLQLKRGQRLEENV